MSNISTLAEARPTRMVQYPTLKRVFWAAGLIMLAFGTVGVVDRLANGHSNAGYNNVVVWGQWVANYIFFIGLSAGAFLLSSLVYVFNVQRFESIGRHAVFTALVTLLLALVSIVFDLGHMDRAWHVMTFANFKSPMAWMIYLYSFYTLVLATEMWFILRRDLVRGAKQSGWRRGIYRIAALGSRDDSHEAAVRDRNVVRVLATIGVPVAITFPACVGALFGTVAARPHWHSGLFPILFLLSAVVSGGALLLVVAAVFKDGLTRNRMLIVDLGKLVLAVLLLDVMLQISEFLVAFRGGIPGHTAGLRLMLFGPKSGVFWFLQVALGVLIPVLLLVGPWRTRAGAVAAAGALIAVGIYGLRLNIVIPGLAAEEVRGLTEAVTTARISADYFPSMSEWMLSFAVLGFGFLLFGVGEVLLPHETNDNGART